MLPRIIVSRRLPMARPGAVSLATRAYTVPTMPSSSPAAVSAAGDPQTQDRVVQEPNPIQALYNKENESMLAHHMDHHSDHHHHQAPRSLSDDIHHGTTDSFSPSFNSVFDE